MIALAFTFSITVERVDDASPSFPHILLVHVNIEDTIVGFNTAFILVQSIFM